MKKIAESLICAALAAVMSLPSTAAVTVAEAKETIALPAVSESADDITADELSTAILRFKEVFGETDKYEIFNHSYSTYQNLKVFNLEWIADNESISASITETGLITSYSYSRTKIASGVIVPEITKNSALTAALDWVAKITPEYMSYVSDQFAKITYNRGSGRYNIILYANINGRKIADSSITVRISSDGTLLSYQCSSMPYNTQPPMDNGLRLIGEDAAAKKLASALPFKPVYRTFSYYNSELGRSEATVKLVYVPSGDYGSTVVNAITGDILTIVYPESDILYDHDDELYTDSAVAEDERPESGLGASNSLTEAELGAVELQEGFKTADELKEMLLEFAVFDFDSEYRLASSNVSKSYDSYTGEERYVHTSVWRKTDENGKVLRATLTCDAETGEIIGFSRKNYNRYEYSQWSCTADALAEKAVAAFAALSAYSKEYQADYDDYLDVTYSTVFSIRFNRYYQDILVEADSADLTLDPTTGLVLNYHINRVHAALESSSGAMTAAAAADTYYRQLGLEPYYIAASKLTDSELTCLVSTVDSTEKLLVPVYDMEYYCYVDAFTGKLVNASYEEYTKSTPSYFDRNFFAADVGHPYEKSIKLLFNMNYIDGASTFRPDDAITEEEFADLLDNIVGYYALDDTAASTVTKTEAAKMIVTALGYDRIASLEGIYRLPFENTENIAEEDVGYVAIAWALGLFDGIGDSFDPSETLTRGEAAAILEAYILSKNA